MARRKRLEPLSPKTVERLRAVPLPLACIYPAHRAYALDYCLIPFWGRGVKIVLCGVCRPNPWRTAT